MSLRPGDVVACQSFDAILDDNYLEEPELLSVSVFQLDDFPRANFIHSYRIVTIVDDESKMHILRIVYIQ